MAGYVLSEEDRDLLQRLLDDNKSRLRELIQHNRPEPIEPTPEVYIAKVPQDGIPALIADMPGSIDCDIYRILDGRLTPIDLQKPVYNLCIRIDGNSWTLVSRDKFGSWVATTPGACNIQGVPQWWCLNPPPGEPGTAVGTGTHHGTGIHQNTGTGSEFFNCAGCHLQLDYWVQLQGVQDVIASVDRQCGECLSLNVNGTCLTVSGVSDPTGHTPLINGKYTLIYMGPCFAYLSGVFGTSLTVSVPTAPVVGQRARVWNPSGSITINAFVMSLVYDGNSKKWAVTVDVELPTWGPVGNPTFGAGFYPIYYGTLNDASLGPPAFDCVSPNTFPSGYDSTYLDCSNATPGAFVITQGPC